MNKDIETPHLNRRYKLCQKTVTVYWFDVQLQSRNNPQARQGSTKSLGEPKTKYFPAGNPFWNCNFAVGNGTVEISLPFATFASLKSCSRHASRVYSQTPTIETKSDPLTRLSLVNDSLNRKITQTISKPVKMTEFQILDWLSFRLKNLHYVGDFGHPQHND